MENKLNDFRLRKASNHRNHRSVTALDTSNPDYKTPQSPNRNKKLFSQLGKSGAVASPANKSLKKEETNLIGSASSYDHLPSTGKWNLSDVPCVRRI